MILKKNDKCGCKTTKTHAPVKDRVSPAVKKPGAPKRESGPKR